MISRIKGRTNQILRIGWFDLKIFMVFSGKLSIKGS